MNATEYATIRTDYLAAKKAHDDVDAEFDTTPHDSSASSTTVWIELEGRYDRTLNALEACEASLIDALFDRLETVTGKLNADLEECKAKHKSNSLPAWARRKMLNLAVRFSGEK